MTSFKETKVGKVALDVATSSIYLVFILFDVLRDQYDKVHYMMSSPKKNNNSSSSGNSAPAPTFKEQLDNKAIESRIHENESEGSSVVKTVVDTISHVIPAAAPIIGGSNPDSKVEENKEEPAGPPHRPEHDTQIEEFVREQHRSTIADNPLFSSSALQPHFSTMALQQGRRDARTKQENNPELWKKLACPPSWRLPPTD
ncbi:hypothetical protein TrVFT333_000490 [Trichoderma virens FT-333]|nr:hypothetical protein TrVFT333_000490 [Trichoderma virens FT-333]